MKYRKLGHSDLQVSAIGLGTMSFPECYFGNKPARKSLSHEKNVIKIIDTALGTGINLIDTAEGYGLGYSEEMVGKALKSSQKRSKAIVISKVGPLLGKNKTGERRCDLSRKWIVKRCEKSLKRLQMSHIDLYLAHWPDPETAAEETMTTFEQLQKEGKIRYYGVSNYNVTQLAEALQHGQPVANEMPYSLLDRAIDRELREFSKERNVGIIAHTPFAKGILSGKYDLANRIPSTDPRATRPHFAEDKYEQRVSVAQKMGEYARELGMTTAQLALAWVLAREGVACTIPGASSPAQVVENAKAADARVPQQVLDALSLLTEGNVIYPI